MTRKPIEDEFKDLPVSRNRKYMMRMRKEEPERYKETRHKNYLRAKERRMK